MVLLKEKVSSTCEWELADAFIIDLTDDDDNGNTTDSDSGEVANFLHNSDENQTDSEIEDNDDGNQQIDVDSLDSDDSSNDSTDDELIQNIVSRQNASSTNPASIKVSTVPTDLSFHPDSNIIAVSDMEGHILFYNVDENTERINDISVHTDNIRSLDYFEDGLRIASVSSDGHLRFTNVERKKSSSPDTHESDLEFYIVKTLTNDVCVTGHENGTIKLWDVRVKSQIASVNASDDTVNCIHYSSNTGRIYLTTGYGELLIYDVRYVKKFKALKQSDPHTSELTCCTTVRNERQIVCGTSEGDLLLFDWEPFDYQHYKPNSSKKEILTIVGATENIVITGYENGSICACHLYPNQPIGLIGSHSKWDVTKLDINHSGSILSSLAEDEIKFWDISFLEDIESVISRNNERDKTKYALPSSQIMSRQEFFSDLHSEDT